MDAGAVVTEDAIVPEAGAGALADCAAAAEDAAVVADAAVPADAAAAEGAMVAEDATVAAGEEPALAALGSAEVAVGVMSSPLVAVAQHRVMTQHSLCTGFCPICNMHNEVRTRRV